MKKTSFKKVLTVALILLTGVLLLSSSASAEIEPYLFFPLGNYDYNAGTKELSFSAVYSEYIMYTDQTWEFDSLNDPIIGAELLFGTLMNSTSNNLTFGPDSGGTGPVTFSIDGFFTATINNFVVDTNSTLLWASFNNIQIDTDAPSSRYVDELLANGGGSGNIYINFSPTGGGGGGIENFIASSDGTITATVAAPEPVSAILFVAGGATLAARRYWKRKKT